MLKGFLGKLDAFLPPLLPESVQAPLLYRGRVIVATSIVSLLVLIALWVVSFLFQLQLVFHLGIILSILTISGHLYFLKQQNKNFERNVKLGAILQVLVLSSVVYLTTFSIQGMGFFGLIWLIPIFLMVAFYFSTFFSFYFALINYIIFFLVSNQQYDHFYAPFRLPNFPKVFFLFLSLVIACTYLLAFLFINLSEELQREVLKQRDLLVESAKFQSLGQMASNLAHDINNPLFTIQGKLHQMRNLLSRDQLDLKKCDQIVESVESTLLRLSQIVKGISTFAREGRGDQMVSISVAELIENNLALAKDRIKNQGIELEIDVDPKASVICYPSFISQVLLNLLNNAIDALENAEVKGIKVKAFLEKNWIHIIICDTGSGVPKDLEAKIFEPFFTTKTLGKGTGLGLSISKGLIEVHEGELTYGRQNDVTCFQIKLPSYE